MREKKWPLPKKRGGGPQITLTDEDFIREEIFYRALACKTRLKILVMLERKPMFGYELVSRLDIGQSTVSYHLGILREAGLITAEQQTGGTLFSVVKEGLKT